ncbi:MULTISPECIES: serine/threonine-protein kinase [unclassified Coleofasciculus]|uniref:serine/threonine-protein kinase n=1 Tax=unclassified Coleofasciculus TaxID=2692782 RepID=UPI0018823121|nr:MULTISPECIES: serine/threonine-protein kinase [unclassified Coleofasciculus]MBE9129131.1 GUN4 domain-containing protein [Coleofasciculus sp. LEGE 07081]MBE9151808.1 GUN4 domain-containing protein [Coleofasciculus sp. LEGE 07092]
MSYCVTPRCLAPENLDSARFCLSCGVQLWLNERYRPLQPISHGGFGRTFLAIDEDSPSKPRCVIKQLYMENASIEVMQKAKELFRQEAVRLQELGKHSQIPTLLAHFEQNRQLYLIQEWIPGQTLTEELRQNGAYNETQIWELLQDLLPIVQYIHNHRVIHRDIKPANIIRRRDDSRLVLIDFGVAKLLTDTALLSTGTIIGSPEYMAPEQVKGKAFWASDLYSVGVTCIYLLTQVSPFDLYDSVNDGWAWRDFLPPRDSVSDRLGKLLDKLLYPTIKQRYQSAADVLADLTPIQSPPSGTHFINLWQPTTGKSKQQNLASEVGVNYHKLKRLLSFRQWQKADEETWVVMCQACGKAPGYYLKTSDIQELPCEDLRTIDQLWVKYSGGRFGFTAQKRIYQQVDGDYPTFCELLGWSVHNPHVSNSAYRFKLNSPVGHLPSRRWVGGYYHWWHHAGVLAAKLEECAYKLW